MKFVLPFLLIPALALAQSATSPEAPPAYKQSPEMEVLAKRWNDAIVQVVNLEIDLTRLQRRIETLCAAHPDIVECKKP